MKPRVRRLVVPPKRSEEEEALISKYQEKKSLPPPRFSRSDEAKGDLHVAESQALFDAKLGEATGTVDRDLSLKLLSQIVATFVSGGSTVEKGNNALSLLYGIKPQDEVEGMLSAQMISTHELAMEFLRRAARSETVGQVDAHTNMATKLLRTYTAQMEALSRYRTKGQQRVVVEHVNVSAGGQAIVGLVEAKSGGRGGSGKS